MHQGVFITIEGSDGSGKGTQFKLLVERLKAEGYEVATYDFPQYASESSYFVREYLNGAYGSAEATGPYTPSLFFALDRFSAAQAIAADLAAGKVVLSNRFTASSMAHQATKFASTRERAQFFTWLDQLEFGMLQIPKPDQNVVLLVPADIAQTLVGQKAARSYTKDSHDIHEADLGHLQRAVETYQQLCSIFPETFTAIDCTENGELMSIPTINNLIWERIQPMLKKLPKVQQPPKGNAAEPKAPAPTTLDHHTGSQLLIHTLGESVHANEELKPDQKIEFYTPSTLPKKLAAQYVEEMQVLLKNYQQLKSKIVDYLKVTKNFGVEAAEQTAKQLSESILPMAVIGRFSLNDSSQTVESNEINQILSTTNVVLAALTAEHNLQPFKGADDATVQLVNYYPRNELDTLPLALYPYSTLSLQELRDQINKWNYQVKSETLKKTLADEGRAYVLKNIFYEFDIVCSYQILRELRPYLNTATSQALTPHYGFTTPEMVSQAGLDELFEASFMRSMQLYQSLIEAELITEAQYTVLWGHKLRTRVTICAQQLYSQAQLEQPPLSASDLVNNLRAAAHEVHPIFN